MYSRVTRRFSLQTGLAFVISVALLTLPNIPILVSGAAQRKSEALAPKGKPRPGRPEGVLPDLEAIENESGVEREAPPPIPSTIRSQKNSGKPWDGRRVGDPWPEEKSDRASNRVERNSAGSSIARTPKTRRAHTRSRMNPPPPVLDDQFVQNFFSWALVRNPNASETTYWYDHLRVAYGQGSGSVKLAAIEFGRTLFESAEYAGRGRSDHWYVYDLYKTYLMRDPDSGGWTNWEATVGSYGREYVRRGFEESGEFATLIANIVPNGSASSNAASLTTARVDPRNQPGNGMLTRDAVWSVPLLSLPGRAGLDLGLGLSYSSQVWTRSGPYIYFDEDSGFPSPGFRLGFPTIQHKVFNAQTTRNTYLMITASGHRIELRQVGTSNIYDAADSSYLRLTENGNLVVQSPDGSRLNFVYFNGDFRCTEVKDRNGNYILVNYNSLGQIINISDTLGRAITFNYDGNANLLSITQAWNGQPSHQWVSFGWGTRTMQSSFTTGALVGTQNGTLLPVITQVVLNDTSHFTFDYNNSMQLSVVRNYFGTLERSSTTFNYETPAGDAPRLTDSRVSAYNWTGLNNVPAQVITQYSVASDGACVMTAPDGTSYKEYYGTGWQKGLSTLSEVWSGGVRRKWTTTAWTQDDTNLPYPKNPRIYDTSVYDEVGNRRRTEIIYTTYNLPDAVALPTAVKEYAANGTSVLRRTTTTYYDGGQPYLDRRMLGLLREVIVYDENNQPQSKVWYDYDWNTDEFWAPTAQPATQHDASGDARGRGNLVWIGRWDVSDIDNFDKHTRSYIKYNRTGSVIKTEDHFGHGNTISYTDSFSDAVNRNTFAYPTTLTDEDGFSSYLQYNFDFGGTTRRQSPAPAGQSQGAIKTMAYNTLGQLERVTTANNGAYTRYIYGSYYVQAFSTVNNIGDEAYNIELFDGMGRVTATAANHPGSTGGYRAQLTTYDLMGRSVSLSNPTEITGAWVPAGDDAAGFYSTTQTYDWKGRPLRTTHPDTTYKEASYSGCGCAGGEVVTLTDEGTIDAGIAKRRQQRIYSDVLGRTVKNELFNWQGGSVYAATVTTYNALDQVTLSRAYAGAEGSGTFQNTTMSYDGYGRLKTRHVPEQTVGTNTVWTYNADDTISSVTDARGASTTYGYNSRHLVTSISYSAPSGIPVPASVSFGYDAAGNRTAMSEGSGATSYSYDQLSRMSSETRTITGAPSSSYTIAYSYNLADELASLTDPQGRIINYVFDTAGRLNNVSGSGYSISSFASNYQYRAWGAPKHFESPAVIPSVTSSLNYSYNTRLQLTHFEFVTPSYSIDSYRSDYQYYADGEVRFISDARMWSNGEEGYHAFDRAYRYDHGARLTLALTGNEARGGTTTDGPYKETYQYDTWGHMTNRMNRIWSRPLDWYDTSFVNNRNQLWYYSYDADGNPTNEGSFDAAGRKSTYNSSRFYQTGFNPNPTWNPSTVTNKYDGDGQLIKQFEAVGSDHWDTYVVRSTVLQGAVILWTEVATNPVYAPGWSNTIRYGSIYAAGERIAQVYNGSGFDGNVTFEFPEPFTGRRRGIETDPLGQEVGSYDPGPDASGDVGSYPEQHEFGNVEDMNLGCTADGITIDCNTAMRLLNTGVVGLAPTNSNRAVADPGNPGQRMLVQNGVIFGETILGSFWEWVDDSGAKPTGQPTDDPGGDVIRINGWIPRGHWGEMFQLGRRAQPRPGRKRGRRTNSRRRRNQTPPAPPPSACTRFAQELSNRLYNTVVLAGGLNPDSRHGLANDMNSRGRNNVDFNGRAFGKNTYPIDGFRPALTANGQLADVYRHILFTAGNSLHGTPAADAENTVFRLYDWQQSARGRAESDAELADDDAGMAVGELMLNTALGGASGNYAQLMADIRNILCAF